MDQRSTLYGATFSPDRTHRYSLSRDWDGGKKKLAVIGLNPSTADETKNDPTVTRCITRARDLNMGGLLMLNIYGFRATDPDEMWQAAEWVDIEGHGNRRAFRGIGECGMVIAAWGAHGLRNGQCERVMGWLREEGVEPYCLGVTRTGMPRHPLYIRRNFVPIPYQFKPHQKRFGKVSGLNEPPGKGSRR